MKDTSSFLDLALDDSMGFDPLGAFDDDVEEDAEEVTGGLSLIHILHATMHARQPTQRFRSVTIAFVAIMPYASSRMS